MKQYGEYTKIIENISNIKKTNEENSEINQKRVHLLKICYLQFFGEDPKDSIFMIANILDPDLNKNEIAAIVYESDDNTSSETIMRMISSFSFSHADTQALDFIIESSLANIYFLREVRLADVRFTES